jgi:hypothetical protein
VARIQPRADGARDDPDVAAAKCHAGQRRSAYRDAHPKFPQPRIARTHALETTWDLPSLAAGATANIDVTVPGARRGDFADASLDTSSV